MIKKPNLGDLVLDYSEKGVESVGYVYSIDIDKNYSRNVAYKTLYGIFWLNPNPGTGDFYSLTEINKWITDGTWKYLPVKKNISRKSK